MNKGPPAHIEHVVVRNYRILHNTSVTLNPGMNLIVGDNEAGKSTLLEAIHLALTSQLGGRNIRQQLHPHLFNNETRDTYCTEVNAGKSPQPPEIRIELYLHDHPDLARLKGSNNTKRLDAPGVSLTIRPDDAFGPDYADYLKQTDTLNTIPVEFYTVEWLTFANEPVHPRRLPFRARLIDASTNDRGPSRYLLDVIDDFTGTGDRAAISVAYRLLKERFQQDPTVLRLNTNITTQNKVSDKALSISLDTTSTGSWQNALMPLLDGIPFSMIGKGEQASLRTRLAMESSSEATTVLIEEPENHQSHTRLCTLLDRLQSHNTNKQFIICTHSSFVINKLGLEDVLLFRSNRMLRLTDLPVDTQRYFRKLPGHDTLRLVLARKSILVEGPSDELIIQKAYMQKHGRPPLADGVEVISVGSLSFKRFTGIAAALDIPTAIVTDNDGDFDAASDRWKAEASVIRVCIGTDNHLPSLEQQIANINDLSELQTILGHKAKTKEAMIKWMRRNKTEVGLRIFESPHNITVPEYINDAIEI